MSVLAKLNLELLKNEVINLAGLQSITPADCKLISLLINNKTKHCISETTLKRIFGFALSKFQPSLFTLDALAQFCNYNGWKDFNEKVEKRGIKDVKKTDQDFSLYSLKQNAVKITNFTLQALKNRSGIPYNQTIKRDFLNGFIHGFVDSGLTGATITAPAGYGKTVAICHWVEEKIASGSDDIVLFFSSTALMSVLFSGMDINSWLQTLLGYGAINDFSSLLEDDAKFYLVIDGFDEHRIKPEQFELILNQITDFFAIYKIQDKFKLVLTMRTATWVNNRHELESANNIWYTDFKPNEECINVPLFTMNEINQLSLKINPLFKGFPYSEISDSFKNPLYFQLYYKQHKEDFSFANVDRVSEFEINALFILNKIYVGKYSAEKILIIKKLVECMDFENQNYDVDTLKIAELTRKYEHAYKELLSAGILREMNESNDYQYNTCIRFTNNYYLANSVAKILLYSNNDRFDSTLVQKLNTLFANSEKKLPVLKYCIIHAIKTGQQDSFERLTETNLSPVEKSDLIIFLGDLLNKEFLLFKGNESLIQYFNQEFSKKLFDYFFGMELISNDYKKTLNTLLKFEISNRKRILIYTSLSLISIINLEMDDLDMYLKKLKTFSASDFQSFAINPLNCIDTIFSYLKHGVIKKAALVELTKLQFNPPEDDYNLYNCASNDMLYLLGAYTSLIGNNAKKTARLINAIKSTYKNSDMDEQTSQYGFFVKILEGEVYYKKGDLETVTEIHNSITNTFLKKGVLLTPFMQTLFHCLKIKLLLNTPKEGGIINELKCIDVISEEHGTKVNRLVTLFLLTKQDRFLEAHPNFKKQVVYDYTKMIRNNGLYTEMFYQYAN